MGKSLAAGGAPAGAAVLSRRLIELIEDAGWQSYSTFRGHPVQVAAIEAHLRIAARDGLWGRALELDDIMVARMRELADAHPGVTRIDGRGLHWTIELEGPDWREWRGQDPDPLASRVAARTLEAGVLVATSGEQTSLFIAPALSVAEAELETILAAVDHGLDVADREVESTRRG
jgi:4-aminobutyrate aminotransferase-like enzyme